MIYVVGSSKNKFLKVPFRKIFLVDQKHDGDNIDDMNPWVCELTGLYYMWKNETDDIVGLEHYRRYFLNDENKILSEEEIREILKDNDAILRKFEFKRYGQRDGFQWLQQEDKMKYLIEFLYQINEPDFAMFALHQLETQPLMAQCNMIITKREVLDKYCNWFFGHLKTLDFEKFKDSPRIMGYLTEYILHAWLVYNNYKTTWCRTVTFVHTDLSKAIEITPGENDKK